MEITYIALSASSYFLWPAQAILLGWLINCDVGSSNFLLHNVRFSVGINKRRRRRETLLHIVSVHTCSLASQSCDIQLCQAFGLKLLDHKFSASLSKWQSEVVGELDCQHIYTIAINDVTSVKVDAATL